MSSELKLYFKVFLFITVSLFFLSLVIDIIFGDTIMIIWEMLKSAFIGLGITALLVTSHISAVRNVIGKGNNLTGQDLEVRHSIMVNSSLSLREVKEMLINRKELKTKKVRGTDNELFIKTSPSLDSWGENIHIRLIKAEDNIMEYLISSRPFIRLVYLDNGRNLKNVRQMAELISSH